MTGAKRHRHWFTALWSHFGPFGRQDVHIHPCIEGEGCWRVIIGAGRECKLKAEHHRETLGAKG